MKSDGGKTAELAPGVFEIEQRHPPEGSLQIRPANQFAPVRRWVIEEMNAEDVFIGRLLDRGVPTLGGWDSIEEMRWQPPDAKKARH